jgi:hypothetical protein
MSATDEWINTMAVTIATVLTSTGAPPLELAAAGIRLAWTTADAVEATTPDGEFFWRRTRVVIHEIADGLEPALAPHGVQLGTGPRPSDVLPDTEQVFHALDALMNASRAAIIEHQAGLRFGVRVLQLDAAARYAAQVMLGRPDTPGLDGLDRQVLYRPDLPLPPPWRRGPGTGYPGPDRPGPSGPSSGGGPRP